VLRVGLTGGIGSGKSTAAARLVERGAVLVDSDRLAREVVAPGTAGLAEVVDAFGDSVLDGDGALDRPALAAIVFADPAARGRLNAVMHPLVRARSTELIAAAPEDAIVVQDVPLLVEGGMGAHFPLVVVVHTEVEMRVRRLVEHRGMAESDARARIAAQADDTARKAAADVWLDNSGSPEELTAAVDALWDGRLVPFAADLQAGRTAQWRPALVDSDAQWPEQAARLSARVAAAAGGRGGAVAHVGSTAVPGLPATDVVDLQLGVTTPSDAAAVGDGLRDLGFLACSSGAEGSFCVRAPSARCYASADPGRPAHLFVQVTGSPGWRQVLLLRDWLRADAAARASCLRTKRRASAESDGNHDRYAQVKAAWFDGAVVNAEGWAASSGWSPSLDQADSAPSR
jgi:dephospho-CoA kinase